MEQFSFGEWIIEVEVETTREFYANYKAEHNESQVYRNYCKYCSQFSKEESDFFFKLGINPTIVNVVSFGMDEDGSMPTGGQYHVVGKYIKKPEEILMTVEELVENDFIDDRPDDSIYIGNYTFDFNSDCEEDGFYNLPEGFPEPTIQIDFSVENLPWLLDEKCDKKMYYPARWWQFIKKIKEKLRSKKDRREYNNEVKTEAIDLFKKNGIEYTELSQSEVKLYIEDWFLNFIPKERQREARNVCFSNRKFSQYLWHAFSYEIIQSKDGGAAEKLFSKKEKDECVFLLDYNKVGFKINKSFLLTVEDLNCFNDVVVTSNDFKWTYIHTHEEYCGPYFYSK